MWSALTSLTNSAIAAGGDLLERVDEGAGSGIANTLNAVLGDRASDDDDSTPQGGEQQAPSSVTSKANGADKPRHTAPTSSPGVSALALPRAAAAPSPAIHSDASGGETPSAGDVSDGSVRNDAISVAAPSRTASLRGAKRAPHTLSMHSAVSAASDGTRTPPAPTASPASSAPAPSAQPSPSHATTEPSGDTENLRAQLAAATALADERLGKLNAFRAKQRQFAAKVRVLCTVNPLQRVTVVMFVCLWVCRRPKLPWRLVRSSLSQSKLALRSCLSRTRRCKNVLRNHQAMLLMAVMPMEIAVW